MSTYVGGITMFKKRDRNQLNLFETNRRFVIEINPENRWVKLAGIMPWDRIEDYYAKNMCEDNGRMGISSRIAFGAIYAKEQENLTDTETVQQICENAYIQYFLGLESYQSAPLFDSSMMVHFRKRFSVEFIAQVNEYICTGKWPDDENRPQSPDKLPLPKKTTKKDKEKLDGKEEVTHQGKLILDATVAPSDIRYPSDVSLLAECRENLEGFINELHEESGQGGRKTPYNRHNAHKKTIKFIKRKKKTNSVIRSALKLQLNYVELAINQVLALILLCGLECLADQAWERFDTICKIYLQQKEMFDGKTNRCEGKIMNLRQPFVRAILRNKVRAKYEYGQKLALAKANGHVFMEHQSWENFNECKTLEQSVLNYYNRFGYYPEVILADQIYQTRDNVNFCKKYGIRLSGAGATRKNTDKEKKKQAYNDLCDRNAIEGVNGVLKRRYGLDLIMCYLQHNAEVEAHLQILAMNLKHRLGIVCAFLQKWIYRSLLRRGFAVFQ